MNVDCISKGRVADRRVREGLRIYNNNRLQGDGGAAGMKGRKERKKGKRNMWQRVRRKEGRKE